MTTDAELRELFSRKAEEMELRSGMSRGLSWRIRRRQMFIGTLAAAAVAVVVVGALGVVGSLSSTDAIPPAGRGNEAPIEWREPTVDRLAGVWLRDPEYGSLTVAFRENGTALFDESGAIYQQPAVITTYETSGDTIFFTVESSSICATGDTWAYRTRVSDDGRMHVVHTDVGTGNCGRVAVGDEWTFTRATP